MEHYTGGGRHPKLLESRENTPLKKLRKKVEDLEKTVAALKELIQKRDQSGE